MPAGAPGRSGGRKEQPILVSSYGAGAAELHLDSAAESGLLVVNTSGVAIARLNFVGSAASGVPTKAGIMIWSNGLAAPRLAETILVSDVNVSGFSEGIVVGSDACGGFEGVTLTGVRVFDNLLSGVSSYGPFTNACFSHANFLLEDVLAVNNSGLHDKTDGHSGSGWQQQQKQQQKKEEKKERKI